MAKPVIAVDIGDVLFPVCWRARNWPEVERVLLEMSA